MRGAGLQGVECRVQGPGCTDAGVRSVWLQAIGLQRCGVQGAGLLGCRGEGCRVLGARMQGAGIKGCRMRDAGCGDAVGRGTGMRGTGVQGLLGCCGCRLGQGMPCGQGTPIVGVQPPPSMRCGCRDSPVSPQELGTAAGAGSDPPGSWAAAPGDFIPGAGGEEWVVRHAVSHPKCHPCPKANRADVAGPHRRTWAAQQRVAPAAPFDGVPAAGRPRLCFHRHPTKGRPRSGASAVAGSESGQDEKSFPGPARPAFAREWQEQDVPQRPSRGPDTTAATCTPRPREGCWHGAVPRCGLPWRREKHLELGLLRGFPAWGGQNRACRAPLHHISPQD